MANILITGASGGIGRALIDVFAEENFKMFLHYRRLNPKFTEIIKKHRERGVTIETGQADFSLPESLDDLENKIREKFDGFDYIIHNAGTSSVGLIQDLDLTEWNQLMQVNLTGVFQLTKSFLPDMIKKGGGSIVTVSSIWGICGASCEVAYSASKAALVGFSKALAAEVGPCNIRVNCVAPGLIDTAMNEDMSPEDLAEFLKAVPLGRIGKAEEVASVVKFLTSDKASYITGQVIDVNGGYLR